MSTARDLIKGSLRLIGVTAVGETPSAEEAIDGLASLNRMLSSWSNESLMAYERVREEFTLTSGQASRTIGATGNFVTSRPLEIESASIEDQSASPTAEYPLKILSRDEWAAITQKDTQSTIPTRLHYELSNPNGTLYLWPVPSAANKIVLYSRKPITSIASLDTSIAFPPGWDEAIMYNLAIRQAPEYGRSIAPEVAEIAASSKASIEIANNQQPRYMSADDAAFTAKRRYNIFTGGSE